MHCSLYGKLPAKRDFIAIGAPREFLSAWEPWLQGAITASRATLGDKWQSAFLTAPIWRFWLGADICGRTVIGAFMSSLDGVGRYFPLTLFACADDGAAIPPPEFGSQDEWFDTVETFLMSTLDHDAAFESTTSRLEGLPLPVQEFREAISPDSHNGCPHAMPKQDRDFTEVFNSVRARDHAKIYAGSTFWWTIGGEGIAPVVLFDKGMPDPFRFSAMLSGDFAEAPA
jgi:type VI secretion system protein ImpM